MRLRQTTDFPGNPVVPVNIEPRRNRADAIGFPAFRRARPGEWDFSAGRPLLVPTSENKTAGKLRRSVRTIREREHMLRRIGALVPNASPSCRRAERSYVAGLDGPNRPSASPAGEGPPR